MGPVLNRPSSVCVLATAGAQRIDGGRPRRGRRPVIPGGGGDESPGPPETATAWSGARGLAVLGRREISGCAGMIMQ